MRSATPKEGLTGLAIVLMTALGVFAPETGANDCPAILPTSAGAVGEPRLCQVGEGKSDRLFVCRDYRDSDRHYRVLFRGGPVPKQIHELARHDSIPTRHAVAGRRCDLARPAGVSATASYRGTGVCQDEHGRPLPCGLFEHAAARQPEAMRYFVFYEPDGSGVRHVEALIAGRNEHALTAELAYQIGRALAGGGCCRDEARAYVAHAVALFPDEPSYRAALHAFESPSSANTAVIETDGTPSESASLGAIPSTH